MAVVFVVTAIGHFVTAAIAEAAVAHARDRNALDSRRRGGRGVMRPTSRNAIH
ncbi:hypothetical protein [Nocardia sp. CA-119907]|uniref:hypothetical protein n=1 Tax=Nocardia sp. CA-119907 TaxID=3239973 RepID=UPI003D97079E